MNALALQSFAAGSSAYSPRRSKGLSEPLPGYQADNATRHIINMEPVNALTVLLLVA
eukprot:CAMPEP_0202923028 /NCGR_PEP_ID=MMETSP1392-20130828/78236_1 /ASSEMBLY_ACC=CAM_ASM_000868 /TAXON_ID=225041 /ORGANISM="Chlamydomonas chlamydogama, Strain SAG 11-48b" /LENGTH=56 /DNA_ID=CAMNT_0049616689 /DNA_START=63 /DNA_END=233 /DNA_ORIENTATION=-